MRPVRWFSWQLTLTTLAPIGPDRSVLASVPGRTRRKPGASRSYAANNLSRMRRPSALAALLIVVNVTEGSAASSSL